MAWSWAFSLVNRLVEVRRAAGRIALAGCVVQYSMSVVYADLPQRSAGRSPYVTRRPRPRYGHLNQLTVTTCIAEWRVRLTRREGSKVMTPRQRRRTAGDNRTAAGSISAGRPSPAHFPWRTYRSQVAGGQSVNPTDLYGWQLQLPTIDIRSCGTVAN